MSGIDGGVIYVVPSTLPEPLAVPEAAGKRNVACKPQSAGNLNDLSVQRPTTLDKKALGSSVTTGVERGSNHDR